MLSVLDPLLGTFFELLKNKFLTWIASGGTKVDESRKLGVVVSGKFGYSGRLRAPAMHGVSSIRSGFRRRFLLRRRRIIAVMERGS